MKVGQSVLLTIDGEGDYYGTICFLNAEKSRLQVRISFCLVNSLLFTKLLALPYQLEDVTFGPTNQKIFGVKKFYTNEISLFKIISDVQHEVQNEQSPEIAIVEEVDDEAYELDQKLITNQHAIDTVGEDFDKALDDLFDNEFVGLSAQGLTGKHSKITLIVCSTRQTIYILNMKTIGDVPDRLKEWFESEEHTKVIHGANLLAENLLHCHDIKLKRIFDTMVNYKRLKNIKLPSELAEETNSNEVAVCVFLSHSSIL